MCEGGRDNHMTQTNVEPLYSIPGNQYYFCNIGAPDDWVHKATHAYYTTKPHSNGGVIRPG